MVTNKALTELESWAHAAHQGNGDLAKQHLVTFNHLGEGFLASNEFQQRCQELYGRKLEPDDLERICQILDAIANIEVGQVQTYGPADDGPALEPQVAS